MSSNVHTALSINGWHPDLAHDLPSQWLQDDPNIDDPVNDTGLGPRSGDFQLSLDCCSLSRIRNTKTFMTKVFRGRTVL